MRRRRRNWDRARVVDVVDDPYSHPSALRAYERFGDGSLLVAVELQVVEGHIERPLGGGQEPCDLPCDLERGLPAGKERSDL
jgi:hypothetical protein